MNTGPIPNAGLWANGIFKKLYWAHVISLLGSGVSSVALGLLAHALVGASASEVLGYTLTIRIVVIVLCSPWAGHIGERFGAQAMMIWSDVIRVGIVTAFFFVDAVWQIYVLAIFLNLGAAPFHTDLQGGDSGSRDREAVSQGARVRFRCLRCVQYSGASAGRTADRHHRLPGQFPGGCGHVRVERTAGHHHTKSSHRGEQRNSHSTMAWGRRGAKDASTQNGIDTTRSTAAKIHPAWTKPTREVRTPAKG